MWLLIVAYTTCHFYYHTNLNDLCHRCYWAIDFQLQQPEVKSFSQKMTAYKIGSHNAVNLAEQEIKDSLPRKAYINFYGVIQYFLKKDMVAQHYYRLKNGYLVILPPPISKDCIEDDAEYIIQFRDWLQERDIPLIYIEAPHKVCKFLPELPRGITDKSNENADLLLQKFQTFGIEYIDARDLCRDTPQLHYEMFYKGDTHWKPEYAFRTFVELARLLKNKHGFSIPEEILDIKNYELQESSGRIVSFADEKPNVINFRPVDIQKNVGDFYLPPEHYQFLCPRFKTRFNYQIPSYNIHQESKFNPELMMPLRQIHVENKMVSSKKILLVTDSFGMVFKCFPTLICHEMDYIALNQLELQAEKVPDIHARVEEFKPDVVIVLQTGRNFAKERFAYFGSSKSPCEKTQNTVK